MREGRLSRHVYLCCVVVMCYASFSFYPRWTHDGTEAAISWDVSGYYWYLPSIFIYKDLKHQSFKDSVLNKYHPTNTEFQQGMKVANGNYVMKYSSGMAVMYLPFFTAAHLMAGTLGYPRDGFSLPYQLAIQVGGILISLLGLWYLRKLLLIFYDDKVVAIVLVLLVFGSNYLNYAAIDTGMSHSWLFTVYVFLLLNTHYFYQAFETKYAMRIGLLVGLATLTRPTDVISCLIPLLWGMESISHPVIKKQLRLLINSYKGFLVACVCAAGVISIQLIYWKYVSGHWIVYSYGDQGFSWRHPHAYVYALNYKCGWLTYSPTMFFAIIGIIPFMMNGKNKVAILSFFLLNYYIVSAWNIWWYGGRAMIQSYPVLLFCIAALTDAALKRKILRWLFAITAIAFLYFNIWITYSYHRDNMYDTDFMTKVFFWRVAGRWGVPKNVAALKDSPDLYEGRPKDLRMIYQNDFPGISDSIHAPMSGERSEFVEGHGTSPMYKFAFSGKNNRWLRVQGTFHCEQKEYEGWRMAQLVVRLTNNRVKVKENIVRVYHLLHENETKPILLDMKLPAASYDLVIIFIWNAESDKPIWVNDLKAWTFNG